MTGSDGRLMETSFVVDGDRNHDAEMQPLLQKDAVPPVHTRQSAWRAIAVLLAVAVVAVVCFHVVDTHRRTPTAAQATSPAFIGTACDVLSGSGCNPRQVAAFADADPYIPSKTIARGHTIRQVHDGLQTTMDVSVSQNAGQWAQTTAHGFGIFGQFGAALSELDLKGLFTGSYAYRDVVQRMWSSDQRFLHAHVSYRYTAFTEFVDPNDPELSFTPDMLQALEHLPESPTTDAEWGEWFDFFTTYPQSFVSSIEYGGIIDYDVLLSSIVMESFTGSNQSKSLSAAVWASFLVEPGFPIMATAALSFGWSDYASNEQRAAVIQASSHTSLVAHPAADGQFANVSEWIRTVQSSPVPIKTTLASVVDLMPANLKNASRSAWARLLTMCPRGTDGSICSGRGSCNWQQFSCSCVDHFLGDACEIFDCEGVTCSGHGSCDNRTGLCVCDSNYQGCDCSVRCGQRILVTGAPVSGGGTFPNDPGSGLPLDWVQNCNGCNPTMQSATCACVTFLGHGSIALDQGGGIPYEVQGNAVPRTLFPCGGGGCGNLASTALVNASHPLDQCNTIAALGCTWSGQPGWTPECTQPSTLTCYSATADTTM